MDAHKQLEPTGKPPKLLEPARKSLKPTQEPTFGLESAKNPHQMSAGHKEQGQTRLGQADRWRANRQ